jgi:hypothetical protein
MIAQDLDRIPQALSCAEAAVSRYEQAKAVDAPLFSAALVQMGKA